MKRLTLVLLLAACGDAVAGPPDVLLGDVTGDAEVNIIDAQQVYRWSQGLPVNYPIGETVCGSHLLGDVNADGEVTAQDATAIAEWAVGIESPYPIGEVIDCP